MGNTITMEISLYFAYTPESLFKEVYQVPKNCMLSEALNILVPTQELFGYPLSELGIGVFGIKVPMDYQLQENDRIELYRPLVFDPMESRRRRAIHRKAGILKNKHLKPDRSRHKNYIEHRHNKKHQETL